MVPLKPGDDLEAITRLLPYFPTQKEMYAANINDYAALMAAGVWDWQRTASDVRAPMILDAQNAILAGHHRFLAAALAQVLIPAGVIKVLPSVTARPVKTWSEVVVLAGYRL